MATGTLTSIPNKGCFVVIRMSLNTPNNQKSATGAKMIVTNAWIERSSFDVP
jgi:hypothetical protein